MSRRTFAFFFVAEPDILAYILDEVLPVLCAWKDPRFIGLSHMIPVPPTRAAQQLRFPTLVRAARERNEHLEEQVSASTSSRDQAGSVAGIIYLILIVICLAHLTFGGGNVLSEDVTMGMIETQTEIIRVR